MTACAPSLAVVILLAIGALAAAQERTVEMVYAKLIKNETAISNCVVTWKEHQTYLKGGIHPKGFPTIKGEVQQEDIPPTDVTFEEKVRLVVSNNCFRHDLKSRLWSHHDGGFRDDHYIAVFDGKTSTCFWPLGEYPSAVIRKEVTHAEVQNVHAQPVLLNVRVSLIAKDFFEKLSANEMREEGFIDKTPCFVVEEPVTDEHQLARGMWFEKSNLLIRRVTFSKKGTILLQIDMEYPETPVAHIPKGWRIVRRDSTGSLVQSSAAHIETAEFNKPVSDSEFRVEFPVGTWVRDQRTKSGFSNSTQYIVTEGSSKRPILREDLGASYDQLRKSRPGEAFKVDAGSGNLVIYGGVVVGVLALIVIGLVYKTRGHS